MAKKVYIWDRENQSTKLLFEGALIVGFTNNSGDLYKINDFQVVSGNRKVGEKKTRKGYVLKIENENEILIQFFTSRDNEGTNWKLNLSDKKIEGREYYLKRISFEDIIAQYNKKHDLDLEDFNKLKKIIDLNLNQKKHLSKHLDYPGKQKRLEDTTTLSKSKENNHDKGKNDNKKVYKNKGRGR